MLDDMQAAWERDMEDERRLRDLKSVIQDFRSDPPRRVSPSTLQMLGLAVDGLRRDMDHITAVWD